MLIVPVFLCASVHEYVCVCPPTDRSRYTVRSATLNIPPSIKDYVLKGAVAFLCKAEMYHLYRFSLRALLFEAYFSPVNSH